MLYQDKNYKYRLMANAIRMLSIDAVEEARSGHPGMPMGMADIATILFAEFLRFNPNDSKWLNRDRFILSNGHGSMLQYAVLHLLGYDISIEDIRNFRKLNSKTPGHPEYNHTDGVETTTGPLGQGIANAVGMAIAAKKLASSINEKEAIDHKIVVFVGDGCMMEGLSHESFSLAGHLNLDNLIVVFDDNSISIDGSTSLSVSDNYKMRIESYGFNFINIDGHNYEEIRNAFNLAYNSDKPYFIAAKTVIGYGSPNKSGKSSSHGAPLGKEEVLAVRKELGWEHEAFVIPEDIRRFWKEAAERNIEYYNSWQEKFKNIKLPELYSNLNLEKAIEELRSGLPKDIVSNPTRVMSGLILSHFSKYIPSLIGGSADLTGSNNTKTSNMYPITKDDFTGQYIYYGIREHAMAAIMNGMAIYGNVIPYAGTFLVFSDYMRPAIRLSALMNVKVIYIMTHDSIGVGEDGPTHQPIEHLSSLRSISHLKVFRPYNMEEVLSAWVFAINYDGPTMLVLSRQEITQYPVLLEQYSSKGAYIICPSSDELETKVQIFATGSEVALAIEVLQELEKMKISAEVISMPCIELFLEQEEEYKKTILKQNTLKVAIEAGIKLGWERIIGNDGIFIGMNNFGKSARGDILFKHFGFDKDIITRKIIEKLESENGKNSN